MFEQPRRVLYLNVLIYGALIVGGGVGMFYSSQYWDGGDVFEMLLYSGIVMLCGLYYVVRTIKHFFEPPATLVFSPNGLSFSRYSGDTVPWAHLYISWHSVRPDWFMRAQLYKYNFIINAGNLNEEEIKVRAVTFRGMNGEISKTILEYAERYNVGIDDDLKEYLQTEYAIDKPIKAKALRPVEKHISPEYPTDYATNFRASAASKTEVSYGKRKG